MKSVFNGVGVFLLQKSSSDESSLMTITKTKTHQKTYKKMYEKHKKDIQLDQIELERSAT